MDIIVNGKGLSCADGLTVQDLLVDLESLPGSILVERNAEFVQRAVYPSTVLSEGNMLVLIRFMGGGSWHWQTVRPP